MNRRSSAARLAATGWPVSRQWTRSAPFSSVPVGSVPGIKLESAEKALRAPPGDMRKGQATNPGRSCKFGLRARQATSAPETTDWRRKLAASDAREPSLSRDLPAGRNRRLVQVAAATAARPTGRSAGAHPEIMSQKARNNAARLTTIGPRAGETSPVGALNGRVQRAPATQYAIAPTARKGTPRKKSGQVDRRRGSASEISIRVLRRGGELSCSPRQGKHRGGDHRRHAPSAAGYPAWAEAAWTTGRKELERLGAEQAGHHGDQQSGVTRRWASRDFDRTN